MKLPAVVKHKGKYYVHYNNTSNGAAKLLDTDGNKFPGTPSVNKLEYIKPLNTRVFNNNIYFQTKIGIYSTTTGKFVNHPGIVKLFEEK